MLRTLLTCAAWLVLSISPVAQAGGRSQTPLRNARVEMVATFERLSKLPGDELRQEYRTLSAPVQEDLWTIHLERFLETHPTLTREQRAVVFEGIGLLASGVIEAARQPGNLTEDTYASLRAFEYRAKTVLPADLARAAFAAMSASDALRTAPDEPRKWQLTPNIGTPECDCSSDSDWCNGVTNPTPKCKAARCTMVDGCGTFWLYVCDGLCSTIP